MRILTNLDLNKNELQNFRVQNLAGAPASPVEGQMYYHSADKNFYGWNGTSWVNLSVIFSNLAILQSVTAAFTSAEKTKLAGIGDNANSYVHPATHPATMITGLATVATSGSYTHLTNVPTLGTAASKNTGTTSGTIPILDAGGKLDVSVLPATAISDTSVVASEAAMLASVSQVGDVAVRTDVSKSYILKALPSTTLANWQELLTPVSAVQSVSGKTGVVTLTKADVGLSAVDNLQQATKVEFNTHTTNVSNPHSVTKTQVGLGQVLDYGVASQTQAEAGVTDTAYMTPLKTKQAIAVQAPVQSVAGRAGAVVLTKADVGLPLVDNIQQATKAEFNTHVADSVKHVTAGEKTSWDNKTNKYMLNIGNGSATSFIVDHGLASQFVIVQVREVAAPYTVVYPDIQMTNTNDVTIIFASAPALNEFAVTVIG